MGTKSLTQHNNSNGATKKTTITSVTQGVGSLAVLGFVVIVGTTLWNKRLITQVHSESSSTVLRRNFTSPQSLILPEDEELPHVVYDNLKYRRVCAKSYESILCMIIRYPFEVPLQNPNVTYASPVDERFYNLTSSILLDGDTLDDCRRRRRRNKKESLSAGVYNCLEKEAQRRVNNDTKVLALFTRSSSSNNNDAGSTADFYGTQSPIQRKRLQDYYRDHDILVVGDSMARYVTHSLAKQLETCQQQDVVAKPVVFFYNCSRVCSSSLLLKPKGSSYCRLGRQQPNDNNNKNNNNNSTITLQNMWFKPALAYWKPKWYTQVVTMKEVKSFMEVFQAMIPFLRPSGTMTNNNTISNSKGNRHRPLSIILEFPIAWIQTHGMIVHAYGHIKYNQQLMVQMMMNVLSPEIRQELQKLGFELTNVMALDGFPQHFPSETGGFFFLHRWNETKFTGYPGWNPALLGTTCRGPLPPSSALKRINNASRHLFSQNGMDMKYYANTWEFTNQFWWEEIKWNEAGTLDCVHPRSMDSGTTQLVMYFLQNMIDGYYESQQQ